MPERQFVRDQSHGATAMVVAAEISSRLLRVQQNAQKISITAKNLSVMSARIGVNALSLKVLSQFFDHFAQQTIRSSVAINELAKHIVMDTMTNWRTLLCVNKVKIVLSNHAVSADYLSDRLDALLSDNNKVRLRCRFSQNHLSDCLNDLKKNMQTMQIIAVNARIEACGLLGYQRQLTELSRSVERYTNMIFDDIDQCEHLLREIVSQ